MSEVTYNLDQLHNLVNFGLRSNMITNPSANKKLPPGKKDPDSSPIVVALKKHDILLSDIILNI